MDMQVLDTRRDSSGGYKVDVSRGSRVSRVSSEWFSRPGDERFLSLGDLARSVRGRSDRSRTRVVETALIHVEANRNDPERLALMLPGAEAPVTPTHWSFGQLASQVGAPAAYLRQLPAPLAAINLQYGLTSNRAEQIKTLETDDAVSGGRLELRAVTGPDYGRIYDHELVEAVQKIAGNGTGDTRWKVPGVLDWSTGVYNPNVDISKDTTTLYASDRDVFVFLVDDLNPIEAGRLPDGSPDLYFRGFYCWNSEVGAKTLGMASFYLRAVCQNRNLWGVEDFEEISIRHSKYAANRFAHEAEPALLNFANSSPQPFINGIKTARERIVARSDEDRQDFLRARGFSKAETGRIIETVLAEEGRPPESIFDFVQGITALARSKAHQPVPCVVREAGIAEEDSLAENVMRVALHPLDQFRAFSALIEAGLSEEDIAARFFVSVSTVRQRLRLASVSPTLLEIYGEDGITLEQLMAFSVTDNHARQRPPTSQAARARSTHRPSLRPARRLNPPSSASSII